MSSEKKEKKEREVKERKLTKAAKYLEEEELMAKELALISLKFESLYDLYIREEDDEIIRAKLEMYYPRALRYYHNRSNLIQSLIDSGEHEDFFADAIEANDPLITVVNYPRQIQDFIKRYIFYYNLPRQAAQIKDSTFMSVLDVKYIEDKHLIVKDDYPLSIVDIFIQREPNYAMWIYRKLGNERLAKEIELKGRKSVQYIVASFQYAINPECFSTLEFKRLNELSQSDYTRNILRARQRQKTRVRGYDELKRDLIKRILSSFLENPDPRMFQHACNVVLREDKNLPEMETITYHPETFIYALRRGLIRPQQLVYFIKAPSREIVKVLEESGRHFRVSDSDISQEEYDQIRDSPAFDKESLLENAFLVNRMDDVRDIIRHERSLPHSDFLSHVSYMTQNHYQREEAEKYMTEPL